MTAPITPDERAAMRERHTASRGAVQRGVASLTDVPRLLDALDTAEAERDQARAAIARRRALWEHERAKWNDALALDRRDRDEARAEVARLRAALDAAEAEVARATDAARLYGRIVEQQCIDIAKITRSEHLVTEDGDADWGAIWDRGFELADRAEKAEAEVARLLAERTAAHADDATCASCTHEYVADMEKRAEEAEAKAERQRDRLSAREEQVRRLRAEVTRLHALVADLRAARPAPVWDDSDALALLDEMNHDGRIEYADYSALHDAITAARPAVVREHLPVRPDRETIADVLIECGTWCGMADVDHEDGPCPACVERARGDAHAVLAMWPGESRATVQAEALREAADEVERIDPAWDSALWIADPTSERGGAYHPVEDWLRARADHIAAEGGADRG